ncbi:MAG: amino acid adenylation domain-containing protein, partial [Bacteroidota bacterium]
MVSGFNLSPQQRRFWSLKSKHSTFCIQGRIEIKGEFNASHMADCFTQLVAKHMALRTTYLSKEGLLYPLQVVQEQGSYTCEVSDLSSLDSEAQSLRLLELLAANPFEQLDYADFIPLHTRVIKLAEQRHELLITLPAMSADSSSLKEIVYAFANLYAKTDLASQEQALIQYVQFSEWQNKLLEEPEKNADYFWQQCPFENYRRSQFAFQKQHATGAYQPEAMSFTLPATWVAQAEKLAQANATDLPSIILAALGLLVHKHTGLSEVILGLVASGRKYEQLKATVGLLAKMLPVTVEVDSTDISFTDLLKKSIQATENAKAWAEYFSFDYLTTAHAAEAPIIPIGFEFVDLTETFSASSHSQFTWKGFKSLTEQFRIKVTCVKEGETLTVGIDYDPLYFDPAAVSVIQQQLATLLEQAVASPALPLAQVSALSISEREKVIHQFNSTPASATNVGIVALFEKQVALTPDAIALVFRERIDSYQSLNMKANMFAHCLVDKYNVQRGDLVAILLDRSPLAIISMLAVLKIGAAYVPLDIQYPARRIQHILEDTQAKVLLLDKESVLESLTIPLPPVFVFQKDAAALGAYPPQNPGRNAAPSDLAYVMYTSGSTGLPKGVQITVANMANYVTWANEYYFENEQGKVFGLFTSLAFDLTVTSIFTTLLRGDALLIYSNEDISETLRHLFDPATEVNAVKLTPSHVSLLQALDIQTTNIAYAILGGEALTQGQVDLLWSLNPAMRIFNEYGPTETTVGSTIVELKPGNDRITIGKPIANTRVYVLNEKLDPIGIGEAGEICISGSGLAKGYLKLPGITAERFVPNPFLAGEKMYRTGDLGRWLPTGELLYLGRKDNQVKIRGYRIELGEIEKTLLKNAALREVVVAAQGEGDDKYLVAYLVGENNIDTALVRTELTKDLPEFMIPAYLVVLDKLPLTTNGKIDVARLPNPTATAQNGQAVYVAPRNRVEKQLLEIWEEVLERSNMGVYDNFFTIGGHSIKALQIIARISKTFQVGVSLTGMFADPTIAGLAHLVSRAANAGYQSIQPLPEQEWYEVSYAQQRLWILDKLEANKIVYNMPGAFVFEGAFDRDAFTQTIESILDRHESLRTTFISVDGAPKQKINPRATLGFQVGYTDLRDKNEPWELSKALIQEEASTPFDLEKGPLWRVNLLQVEETVYVVMFTLHHIVGDAWSIGVLVNEISSVYNALSQGNENPLVPLPIQYKDYAAWHNTQLTEVQNLKEYWVNQLSPL